jgi:hypothetical protein
VIHIANWAGMSLHCVAFRVSQLALDGSTPAGNRMYVSDKLMKIDFNPDIEAGPEVSNRGASGNLIQVYRLPDLTKRLTMSVQVGALDPELEWLLTGGTILTSPTGITALGAMGALGSTTATTGGALVPATYGYKVSALSAYGEGAASAEKTQVVPAGTNTNTVTLTWTAVTAGTGNPVYGYRIYGRTSGGPWRKIQDIAAAGSPSYTDLGTITPDPTVTPLATDTTLAAGTAQGYQYPTVGVDPTPFGCGLEAWSRNVAEPGTPGYAAGQQIGQAPYIRWVWPRMFLHKANRTVDMNPVDSTFDGYAVENVNFGNGPNNDWLYDSSRLVQYAYDTAIPTPGVGFASVPAQV